MTSPNGRYITKQNECAAKHGWQFLRDPLERQCHVMFRPVLTALCVCMCKGLADNNRHKSVQEEMSFSITNPIVCPGNAIVLPFHLISCNRFKIPRSSSTSMFLSFVSSIYLYSTGDRHIDCMTDISSRLNGLRLCILHYFSGIMAYFCHIFIHLAFTMNECEKRSF